MENVYIKSSRCSHGRYFRAEEREKSLYPFFYDPETVPPSECLVKLAAVSFTL